MQLRQAALARRLSAAFLFLLASLGWVQMPFPAAAQRAGLISRPTALNSGTQVSLRPALEYLWQGNIGDKVTVEGRAEDNQAGHQVMALNFSGRVFTGQTGPKGEFLLEGIPAGSYTLIASSPSFLSATCTSVTHTGGNVRLNEVILLAGDLDNSGEIDMVDMVQLGAAFGRTGPAERADLNTDSRVDILDLILLAANHGQTAIANPWLCQ
jgi:hypothetical protein